MHQQINWCIIGITMFALSGCATIWTLSTKPENVQRDACFNNCSIIPRIYSGTAMDACVVFSPDSGQGGAILFYDLLLSFPLDTIVLPYTVYGQVTKGNLAEPEQCKASVLPLNNTP